MYITASNVNQARTIRGGVRHEGTTLAKSAIPQPQVKAHHAACSSKSISLVRHRVLMRPKQQSRSGRDALCSSQPGRESARYISTRSVMRGQPVRGVHLAHCQLGVRWSGSLSKHYRTLQCFIGAWSVQAEEQLQVRGSGEFQLQVHHLFQARSLGLAED
jgi:hypothetical protein